MLFGEQVFLVYGVLIYGVIMDLILSYSMCKKLVLNIQDTLMEKIPY